MREFSISAGGVTVAGATTMINIIPGPMVGAITIDWTDSTERLAKQWNTRRVGGPKDA